MLSFLKRIVDFDGFKQFNLILMCSLTLCRINLVALEVFTKDLLKTVIFRILQNEELRTVRKKKAGEKYFKMQIKSRCA